MKHHKAFLQSTFIQCAVCKILVTYCAVCTHDNYVIIKKLVLSGNHDVMCVPPPPKGCGFYSIFFLFLIFPLHSPSSPLSSPLTTLSSAFLSSSSSPPLRHYVLTGQTCLPSPPLPSPPLLLSLGLFLWLFPGFMSYHG